MLPLVGVAVIVAGGLAGLRKVMKLTIREAREEANELVVQAAQEFEAVLCDQQTELRDTFVHFAEAFADAAHQAFEDRSPLPPK